MNKNEEFKSDNLEKLPKRQFLFKKFREARQEICLLDNVMEATGYPKRTLSDIEFGRKVITEDNEVFLKVCEVLGLNPSDYFARVTKAVAFLSNKGGSGKTTTCANLAYTLAHDYNMRILLVDTDLQQNLTQHYGLESEDNRNFYNAFIYNESLGNHITPTGYDNVDIVTGHDRLSLLDKEISRIDFSEHRVKEIIAPLKEMGEYDFIFFDCNPSLNSLNTSVLFGCDGLVVPLVPSAFGKKGLDLILDFYKQNAIRAENLHLLGILVNRVDIRKLVPRDVIRLVKMEYGDTKVIFKTMTPECVDIDKAQLMEEPVAVSFPTGKAANSFKCLGAEFLKRARRI